MEIVKSTLAVNENIYTRAGVHVQTVSTTEMHLCLISLTSAMTCLQSVMKPGVVTLCPPLPVTYTTKSVLSCRCLQAEEI